VPFPAENPFSEPKRVLGKILFWDEQLSTDDTTACGTCHVPGAAGADPRFAVNPGPDLVFMTPDDVVGSPGVLRSGSDRTYVVDPVFGTQRRVTGRSANVTVNAAYATDIFWDGRATSQFMDPETGEVAIKGGGALESQAVGPPLSDVEMAHEARDWAQIAAKLATARPLALATDIPPDMQAALDADPTYPELFAAAFGDGSISARRIAFAIATYERTLISDQSPWDRFQLGETGALTPAQLAGFQTFIGSACAVCHIPPLFTNNSFHDLGLRPAATDLGRGAITGDPFDDGRFKSPTLRNAGLKGSFMHTGQFATLAEVVNFYAAPAFPGNPNFDPLMPVNIPGPLRANLVDFIANGLLDPRVANEQFPFDRPTLRSELAANPAIIGVGTPDGSGVVPRMIARTPPLAGSAEFKLGVTDIDDGATLTLLVSTTPPVGGILTPDSTVGPLTASFNSGDAPAATAFWAVPDDQSLDGTDVYFQWLAEASGARSRTARATIFCGTGGCAVACTADVNGDGMLAPNDFSAWIAAFNAQAPGCDQNADGLCLPNDFTAWIQNFNAGCG
jgi:cytochrome c peroxidase